MVDADTLHELVARGVVTTDENGLRVINAKLLDASLLRREKQEDPRRNVANKKKKTPPTKPSGGGKKQMPEEPKIEMVSSPTNAVNVEVKECDMSNEEAPKGVGLDVGTSFLVSGRFGTSGEVIFKKLRDCFLELEPKTPINKKFIKKGLDDRKAPYIEKDDSFFVLGEEAFLMANERHLNTRRPMVRGVLSPQEREAFPILKELISRLVDKPEIEKERLVFSVPAKPIDAEFDQLFHQDMLRSFINSLGYDAYPMNEAEALAYSELLGEGLTGISMSCGAGLMNVAVMSAGDPVITFSTARSGDWVDQQAAIATNMTNSIVQQEKEAPELDLMNPSPKNQVQAAISVYYGNLLVYTLEQIAYDLSNSPLLPKFKEPVPLVVAGGTSLPKGFIPKFEQALAAVDMPIKISGIRHAQDPLHAVCNGLVLAASME